MQNYHQMVRNLAKPGTDILEKLNGHKVGLMHMAVGLAGEAAELLEATDRENVLEECGDGFFYFIGLRQELNITDAEWSRYLLAETYPQFTGFASHSALVAIYAGRVLDEVKKLWAYNKQLNRELLIQHLLCYEKALELVYRVEHEFTNEDVRNANREKLGKRYPELVYSDDKAQERADKA